MAPRPAIDLITVYLAGSDLRREVLRLVGYILGRTMGERENPSRSAEAGWDSLKHVELMFLLEDHFAVRFSEEEMAELEDADGIAKLLERRRAA
jgi:acyl carrier protein